MGQQEEYISTHWKQLIVTKYCLRIFYYWITNIISFIGFLGVIVVILHVAHIQFYIRKRHYHYRVVLGIPTIILYYYLRAAYLCIIMTFVKPSFRY